MARRRSDMRSGTLIGALAVAAALFLGVFAIPAASEDAADKLATPESFASISDPAARSAAMFVELGKVLTHPRCLNCHPSGDRPRQGDTARLHQPPVERGPDGYGLPAIPCPLSPHPAHSPPGPTPANPISHLP